MMAHRLFVTADAPRRARRLPRRAALFSDVTVMLGDPRLPDPVKRGGRFNPEDIETVARLKTALRELPGYRFRYLDNHATLFADLRASRPHFVLNFCDEGFNNDAFMEMHVPALLEMLDIPYSGAGPSLPRRSATTRRWCAPSPRRSTCRCRPRPEFVSNLHSN